MSNMKPAKLFDLQNPTEKPLKVEIVCYRTLAEMTDGGIPPDFARVHVCIQW